MPEPETMRVSAQTARRFVLGRQGLWPGRRWTGKVGTRAAMTAMEHLQLDPLVIVARSHDLALHSRVVGYRPEFLHTLTYDERLFFDWGGWLAVRPMAELPYWRTLMHRHRERPKIHGYIELHGDAIAAMRVLLHERGTLSNRDFKAADRRAVVSYRGTKDSSLALYYLWLIGEAMTHHRDGFERVYAPTEAVAPLDLVYDADPAETDLFVTRKAIAAAGIAKVGLLSALLARRISNAERQDIERTLVESGAVVAVEVDDWPGRRFIPGDGVGELNDIASGCVPKAWTPVETTTEEEVTLLSPLDPAIERQRANALFGFEYVWEIYKRPQDVVFGRYTMPIVFGDGLAGRTDLRIDRKSKTLIVNGVWLEDTTLARSPEFRDALRAGIQRMTRFLETDLVDATTVADARVRRALTSLNPRRPRKP